MRYLIIGLMFLFSAFQPSEKTIAFQTQSSIQNFESPFQILNAPQEFLPGWTGNQVASSASRIFQAVGLGRGGGNALAVQPISTFNGELVTRLSPNDFADPKVQFYARSLKNGTGTRPAVVFYSWSTSGNSGFSTAQILGSTSEFANDNQEFRKFEIEIPVQFDDLEEVFLRFQINYGTGTGTGARWLMDDFVFGDIIEDTIPPTLTSARGYDEREIALAFSEKLDTATANVLSNYILGELSPVKITISQDSLVRLEFGEKLQNRNRYIFELKGLADRSGNVLEDTVFEFEFFDPTFIPSGGLVLNELMPAPREELILPNVEYVELYHAGDYAYRVENFRWSNSRTEVILGNHWIEPGEYVLVLAESQRGLMQSFGRVIGLSTWPTLLNAADRVTLKDDKGNLLDQISYSTSSWGGSSFALGGYSLEVVNPFSQCDQSEYLMVSKDTTRGTPGRANSVMDSKEDQDAPQLLDSRLLTRKSIVLSFSESLQPDVVSASFVFTPQLNLDSVVFKKDEIFLYGDIAENVGYELMLSGVKDCFGNVYSSTEPIKFFIPSQAKAGELVLSELLFNARAGDPKFVELRNLTDKALEIGTWKLANLDGSGVVSQIRNLSTGSLVIESGGFLAITTDTLRLRAAYPKSSAGKFHQVSSLPSYPISSGTVVLLDSNGQEVERFAYQEKLHHPLIRDVKGVSLERLSTATSANVASNWHSASSLEEWATPGRENSLGFVSEVEEDTIPPMLSRARGYDEREIALAFSEKLDTATANVLGNYLVGGLSPTKVTISQDSLVRLEFGEKLENRNRYIFELKGLADRSGNVLEDTVFEFEFFDPTFIPSGGLVLNELMPAPREELILPNVEYVELYHAGDYAYRVENFRWSNSRTEVILGNHWIEPGEYVLVLAESQRGLMQSFGRVIGLSNWPTLLNTADRVTLKDDKGNLLDQISYSTSSWGGSSFALGGYSLEVVNPFSQCDQSEYLMVSKDTTRGTPGRANSVMDSEEDRDAPQLLDSRLLTRKSIVLSFSESLQPDVVSASFVFTPQLNLDSVVFKKDEIFLYGDIAENVGYELMLSGVKDCFGNVYSSTEPIKFFIPSQAKAGELVLSELLFNARAGDPKFVELRNLTDKALEIGTWKLANLDGSGVVSQIRNLSTGSLVIESGGFLAITTDTLRLRAAYPKSSAGKFHQVSSLPSYPISSGTVVLLDPNGQEVERFAYQEKLHHPLIRDAKGVSLERLSTATSANVASNWHSASSLEEWATPGRENSLGFVSEVEEDTIPPMLSRARGYDEREIALAFSEKLDTATANVLSNYILGELSPVKITISQDSLVRLEFGEKLQNRNRYIFELKGLADRSGNVLEDTVFEFEFFDPTFIPSGGLVLNELMPAPREELILPNVEYVELYHAGDYAYRVENFRWSNSRTEVILGNHWIEPGEYVLVLAESQRGLMQSFGRVIGLSTWPTLLNTADRVTLKDDKGNLLDQISYSTSSWGGSSFASGGYSLEVVNPFSQCDQSEYLMVSKDTTRGTPGRANSVMDSKEDQDAPQLLDSRLLTRKSIVLSFSESLQPDVVSASFVFTPQLNLDSVVFKKDEIFLYGDIAENVGYELMLSGVKDCFGNAYSSTEPIKFFIPSQAKAGELVLSELLFNARAGDPKFVELRNLTDKALEIGTWKLANLDGSGVVSQIRNLSAGSLVIESGGYFAITTDTLRLRAAYPKSSAGKFHQVSSLPSYPISSGTVVLLDPNGQEVERFAYQEKLHHPLIRDVKGVSLERLSTATSVNVASNWHSASSLEEWATPGRENSQVLSARFEEELIQIDPDVFDPEGSSGQNFATIQYELDQAGWVGSFRIYNLSGQVVHVLAENEILGAKGFFNWTGTDDRGVKVRAGYYVLLVELYDLSGAVKYIRKTLVVATRL